MSFRGLKSFLSLIAFVFFATLTILLWQAQNQHERQVLMHLTETTAEQLRIRIEGFVNARIASLELLADRWVERQPPDFSQQRFLTFSNALFRHYPGFTAINWIDPEGYIRWVFPKEENAEKQGKNISAYGNAAYIATIERARNELQYALTPCMELFEGGTGFEILVPLVHDGRIQGYIDGVFQLKRLLDVAVSREIFSAFDLVISEGGHVIYPSMDKCDPASPDYDMKIPRIVKQVNLGGKIWNIQLAPTATLYTPSLVPNFPFLAFGLALSAGLAILLHLLLHRMELYRESRDTALYEIKERKKVEEALRENEKKLKETLDELSAANVEMESFVYTVSHDLKTPIVTIEGFIGALREDFGQVLAGDADKYLKYMSDAALKMESLINDLLNLSRIGRVTEKKTVFPFGTVVKGAIKLLQPQIDARGIEVHVQEDLPEVFGEKKRITQVVDNFLSNAVKYIGKDNPSPRIDVGCNEENGQKVFYFRDNGIGIEEMYFNKIFQIFQRLPAAKRAGDGTGMGLTIVKRIIEYHGGRIWLSSEPGKGTTFFFTLKDKDV